MCCNELLGDYICTNSLLSPKSPFIYCKKCLQMLHYDQNNQLLVPPFHMQQIKSEEENNENT